MILLHLTVRVLKVMQFVLEFGYVGVAVADLGFEGFALVLGLEEFGIGVLSRPGSAGGVGVVGVVGAGGRLAEGRFAERRGG